MNISNTPSVGSPLVSSIYPRTGTLNNSRDSYTGGSILTSFLGSSKTANKMYKIFNYIYFYLFI